MFWLVIYIVCIFLLMLFFRELLWLSRIPKGHPERGLYWFNTFALIFGAALVYSSAIYLDSRREYLEARVPSYPNSVFAPDRSVLMEGKVWIYTTDDLPGEIEQFYRNYGASRGRELIVNSEGGITRMRIDTKEDPVYLTVTSLEGKSILHYSFSGTTTVTEIRP